MKKEKNQKGRSRFPLAVCLLSAICALTGCGGEEQEIQEQMPSYVYVAEQLVTSSAGGYRLPDHFCKPAVADGQLYFMEQGYDVQTVERTALPENGVTVKIDDTDVILCLSVSAIETEKDRGMGEEEILELLDMAMEAGAVSDGTERRGTVYVDPGKDYCRFSLLDYAVDQEQNAYFLIEYSSGGYYAMESMGCVLCRRDAGGEWVYRCFCPELEPLSDSLAADGNGGFYLLTAEGILAVDESGEETGRVDTEIFRGASYSSERLVGNAEGQAYYFVFEEFDSRWKGMEVENQRGIRLKEIEQLSGSEWLDACTVFQKDVLFSVSDTFYVYDRETEECGEMLLWANSNLIGSYVRDIMLLSRDRLLVWYAEPEMEGLYLLVKTPAEELPEREALVLAASHISLELSDAVIRFNRMNGKYQVILESYGYSNETAEGARTRQDTALASSNPPDLVSLEGRDLGRDVEKGLLEDLSPYLEASSVLDREDFLENALEGYTVGGRLVGIPVRFAVTVVGGRSSQLGGVEGWTMEDVYALAERYPEQTRLLNDACYLADSGKSTADLETREHLLGNFCAPWYLEAFVDWEKGECSFDSQEFRRLLVWVGEHAGESGGQTVSDRRSYRMRGYLPEDALLMESRLDFEDAAIWEVQCGEEVTLLGYPTVDGRGTAALRIEAPLGIVAGAGNREGAWEFLEYYITAETDARRTVSLPTSRARLQELMEEAVRQEYPGEEPRAKQWPYLDGETVPVYATSREMAEKLMDFLEEADFTPGSRLRDMAVSIVLEESEAYYTGDKSLDEVVKLIQNRVSLVLAE